MTAEKVIRIHFSEISKVEVTCDKCGAGLTLPVPTDVLGYIPPRHYRCPGPGCDKALWGDENDQRYRTVLGLLRALGNWQQLQGQEFKLSFSLNSN